MQVMHVAHSCNSIRRTVVKLIQDSWQRLETSRPILRAVLPAQEKTGLFFCPSYLRKKGTSALGFEWISPHCKLITSNLPEELTWGNQLMQFKPPARTPFSWGRHGGNFSMSKDVL